MAIVTGDQYLDSLVKFVENQAERLIEGTLILKLNPVGLRYVQSRLEALEELESLLAGAPVDYLRAYVSDLGDHRALEQLRKILRLLPSLKVVSVMPPPGRDPTPLYLLPFGCLKVLELRGCDLSTSAAKGLLELRFTLEKLICHNSTDALRHVFAPRITEIKESPYWNHLSVVSCACNKLVLMDEALQLLPAVESLDLSRNKFSKVDNLHKCTKLKHLDLGFNNLRSIASYGEVPYQILKLDLRNNALSTLHGIENLKSLEGLDLSYNIISNFNELEILSSLPSLHNLWLEGNPLCCARWFRAQVFSFFPLQCTLKLDEKRISSSEFWERKIIVASRMKQLGNFGFYFPAKDDTDLVGINTKKKSMSRVVSIESEKQFNNMWSDQESISYGHEILRKDENAISEEETEIEDLMKRIEVKKKVHSTLWLQEFKDWMNQASDSVDGSKLRNSILSSSGKTDSEGNIGEEPRCSSEPIKQSGVSTMNLESEISIADTSTVDNMRGKHKELVPLNNDGYVYSGIWNSRFNSLIDGQNNHSIDNLLSPSTAILNIEDSSSAFPGSPPHYQEDMMHRRHDLEEIYIQLSAETFSVSSSDSNTSCDEGDSEEFDPKITERCQGTDDSFSAVSYRDDTNHEKDSSTKQNGSLKSIPFAEGNVNFSEQGKLEVSSHACTDCNSCSDSDTDSVYHDKFIDFDKGEFIRLEPNCIKNPKKRMISFAEEDDSCRMSGNGSTSMVFKCLLGTRSGFNSLSEETDDFIATCFNSCMANSGVHEFSMQHLLCCCLFPGNLGYRERDVAIIRSSKHKLYILLIVEPCDGSGIELEIVGCHMISDVRNVFVGIGLQVVRVHMEGDSTYLFITRCMERSRRLFCILDFLNSFGDHCSLTSLEQFEINLFEETVCKDSMVKIFQYSMVFFWHSNLKDDMWLSRSIFVLEGHLVLCTEDLLQFALNESALFTSNYFLLDASCAIANVSQMEIDTMSNLCVALALESTSDFHPSGKPVVPSDMPVSPPSIWKLKWFSKQSLLNFIAVLKAMHEQTSSSPLLIRYKS